MAVISPLKCELGRDHGFEIIISLIAGVRYLIERIDSVTISVSLQSCQINIIYKPGRVPCVQ